MAHRARAPPRSDVHARDGSSYEKRARARDRAEFLDDVLVARIWRGSRATPRRARSLAHIRARCRLAMCLRHRARATRRRSVARSPRCVPSSSHPVLVADASSSITTTRLPLARFPLRSDRPPRSPSQASASIATLLASSTDPMTGAGPLHLAAERGSLACVATLLESDPTRHSPRDDERAVPLHYAAARGHDVIVRALLHAGAVPDARDDRGRTPAHYAAGAARRAALASLLDAGAHPDARDEDGRTPAHYAACADDAASVEELVARGANVDAMSARGMTPSDDARARRRRVAEAALARLGGRETSARYEPTKAGYEPTSAERQGEMERGRGDGGYGEIRVGSSRGGSGLAGTTPGSTHAPKPRPPSATAPTGRRPPRSAGADTGTRTPIAPPENLRASDALRRPLGPRATLAPLDVAPTVAAAAGTTVPRPRRGGGDTKSAFLRRYGLQETPGLFRPDECV